MLNIFVNENVFLKRIILWLIYPKFFVRFSHFFKFIFKGDELVAIDGEWKAVSNLEFIKTQRGRDMLVYEGYKYVSNRQSTKNTFWRCSHYVKFGCRASVVTSKESSTLRHAGAPHSHPPDKQLNRTTNE